MREKISNILGVMAGVIGVIAGIIGVLLSLAIILAQLGLGWLGIEHHLGWWAAAGSALLFVIMRTTFPFIIGTYFGVVDVIGWPWWAGILITLPGLVFVVPAVVSFIVIQLVDWIRTKRS